MQFGNRPLCQFSFYCRFAKKQQRVNQTKELMLSHTSLFFVSEYIWRKPYQYPNFLLFGTRVQIQILTLLYRAFTDTYIDIHLNRLFQDFYLPMLQLIPALPNLPPLRFHCVRGYWDLTQDFAIGSQTLLPKLPKLWFFAGFSLYFARRINEAAMGGAGDIIF